MRLLVGYGICRVDIGSGNRLNIEGCFFLVFEMLIYGGDDDDNDYDY